MAAYLIEACHRRGVALKVVGDGLEVEFDRMRPPHDLIDQLRQHKVEVIRRLRGESSEEPYRRDPKWGPRCWSPGGPPIGV